ncbi:hypothetical protein ACLOJK_025104 [Asimina triloba]
MSQFVEDRSRLSHSVGDYIRTTDKGRVNPYSDLPDPSCTPTVPTIHVGSSPHLQLSRFSSLRSCHTRNRNHNSGKKLQPNSESEPVAPSPLSVINPHGHRGLRGGQLRCPLSRSAVVLSELSLRNLFQQPLSAINSTQTYRKTAHN